MTGALRQDQCQRTVPGPAPAPLPACSARPSDNVYRDILPLQVVALLVNN